MSETRRLGRGLEDISHLFLSSQEERLTFEKRADTEAGRIPSQSRQSHQYVCLVGDQPDLHHAFGVFQLSSALARSDKRIAVVDMDKELPCFHFFTGSKPGSDISIGSRGLIREGPPGMKVAGLDATVMERLFSTETTDAFLRDLERLEEEHDVILLSVVQGTLLSMDRVLPAWLTEFVVSVDRDKFKMLAAYKTIKAIFSVHPQAHVGTIITPIIHAFEADLVHDKMSGAVAKFLHRELDQYGFLYKTEKEPSPSSSDADLSSCMSNIAQNLVTRLNLTETSSRGQFFRNLFAGYVTQKVMDNT